MKKRVLSIIVCLAMVVTTFASMPGFASAETAEGSGTNESAVPAVNYDNVASFDAGTSAQKVKLFSARSVRSITPDNGLNLSKTATDNGDGTYKITLEAYTTGNVTAGTAKPSDIILVLDLSTSMKKAFSGNFIYTISRLDAMKQAATSFVDEVAEESTADRIAIVGFHTSGVYMTGGSAATAFQDATTSESALKEKINGIDEGGWNDNGDLEGATEHGEGLKNAVEIFNAQSADTYTNRNKVVVMLTDGEPAPLGTGNWSSRTVKQAIENAYVLKNTHGAKVYTVSVMPGTNAANPTSDMDKYMDYVSSNYPNACFEGKHIDDESSNGYSYYSGSSSEIMKHITPGTKIDTSNGSFYLTAGDISTLESIFGQIAEQTGGASIQLDESAVINDIIADYFTLPEGANESSITVSTKDAAYTDGVLGWKNSTITDFDPTVRIEGKNVYVNGFDFNKNFVAETGRVEGDVSQEGDFHGRKLIIEFNVVPDSDFLGGNGVTTNGSGSGVYKSDGTSVETFQQPVVNVPVKSIAVNAQDKNIYFGNATDITDIIGVLDAKVDGTNNDYVEITYTVKDGDTVIGEYTVPKGATSGSWEWDGSGTVDLDADKTYTITCKVDGTNDGDKNVANSSDEATVRVFKPTVTYADKTVYYGDNAPNAYSPESTVWKHGDTDAGSVTMEGTAPVLEHAYQIPDGVISDGKINTKEDFHINVTTKIGTADVTEHVTFVHEDCGSDCGFDKEKGEFMLHVKTVSLTVKKTGGEAGEAYVFDIKKDNAAYTTVLVRANGTVTVNELPVGEYTVTEDENWAWRYTPEFISGNTATLGASNPSATIICNNAKDTDTWLNFSTVVRNVFGNKNN